MKSLLARHLVERDNSHSTVSIHRSFQLALRYKLRNGDSPTCNSPDFAFQLAVQVVRAVVPNQSPIHSPTPQDGPTFEKYYAHVISLHTLYKDKSLNLTASIALAELFSDISYHSRERGMTQTALDILGTAEEICNKVLRQDDPNLVRVNILYLRASIELEHGCEKRREGIEHKIQIANHRELYLELSSTKETRRDDELRYSTALNNLGAAYIHSEDWGKAEELLSRSMELKHRCSNEDSQPDYFAEGYKNQALVKLAKGETQEALRLSMLGIKTASRHSGGPNTRFFQLHMFLRACILFCTGDVEAALKEHQNVLEARRKIFGDSEEILGSIQEHTHEHTHEHTLDSMYMVGAVHLELNEVEEAV